MKKVKTIAVKMTKEQMQQMRELFETVDKTPGVGFVIGQIHKNGTMMVGFTTPYEVKRGMEKTISKLAFSSEYNANAQKLCPECDSEILPDQTCMMGHWCGEPVVPESNESAENPS